MKYDKHHARLETRIPGLPPPKSGKVRDVFDLGDTLLMVVTDRISAFDVILPCGGVGVHVRRDEVVDRKSVV